jgi:hypothetical protein
MGNTSTGFTSNVVNSVLSWTRKIEQTKYSILIIVLVGVIVRLAAIPLSASAPNSPVDVYYVDNQSAKLLLSLKNPYIQQPVVNGHSYLFVYLPIVAVYYVPFYLLGDIRFGNIVADIIIMFSVYWVAKSINRGAAFFAPLAFAVSPLSILLTSISATNIMVGTSFLTLSIATLLKKKYLLASLFLGVALATNQLVAVALPVLIYYFWDEHKFSYLIGSLLLSAGIILPFFITAPAVFLYNVVLFHYIVYESNGPFSLYSLMNATASQSITSWFRVGLFLLAVLITIVWLSRKKVSIVPLVGVLLLLGAFILPANGFLNYYLPSAAFVCALVPYAIDVVAKKMEKSSS